MLISKVLAAAINEQVAHEFEASHIYLQVAGYFEGLGLKKLAKMFFKQSDEEREHGLKFVHYVVECSGDLQIPATPAPNTVFKSVEDAIQKSLDWEWEVTRRINKLMDIAVKENDYLGQGFLQWFVDEQKEEITTMENLLKVIKAAGEKNIFMLEAYLSHND